MASFNQVHQVIYANQYNADTIINNLQAVNDQNDLIKVLGELQQEVNKAIQNRVVANETADELEQNIADAIKQAKQPELNKNKLVQHLTTAKEIVAHVTGLATTFKAAIATVSSLFAN